MINRFIKLVKKNGFFYILKYCSTSFLEKTHINYFSSDKIIYRRRLQNSQLLWKNFGGVVKYGPFKGFFIDNNYKWGKADVGNMLLGIYEKEVLDELVKAAPRYDILVDLGAADGYFAVGSLVNKIFKKTYCYEQSADSQNRIEKSAKINRVSDRIQIYGYASRTFYRKLLERNVALSRCVILCDIEGGEFDLFNKKVLKALKDCLIIIEIHSWHRGGQRKVQTLKKNANRYFKITELKTGSRDLSSFLEIQDLKDDDRWLLCSEGRHWLQTWLKLTPRKDRTIRKK